VKARVYAKTNMYVKYTLAEKRKDSVLQAPMQQTGPAGDDGRSKKKKDVGRERGKPLQKKSRQNMIATTMHSIMGFDSRETDDA